MIHINRIQIDAFRGIKNLVLEPKGGNFGICGPNGSGKSAIVDAIEFCLTGQITRLRGRGRGEISVEQHAGHIDFRSQPERSTVKIWANVPSLQHDITLSRSVARPYEYLVSPDLPEVHKVIQTIESHPEFVLARREVERTINAIPSERASTVQTLLKLQRIGGIRASFNRYVNSCKKDYSESKLLLERARKEFKDVLSITELKKVEILSVINPLRRQLSLPDIDKLTNKTLFLSDNTSATTVSKNNSSRTGFTSETNSEDSTLLIRKLNDILDDLADSSMSLASQKELIINQINKELPSIVSRDETVSKLTLIQDRYDRYIDLRATSTAKEERLKKAEKLLQHFESVSSQNLDAIYDQVAVDFAEYYKYLNGDEDSFEGNLTTNGGRVEFAVDFHGRGKFPAIAYHSEGHQDSMGLCLYLALTKHSLKEDFTIAVIDDIVGSVDVSHRNKLCRLLRRKFPNTQFILTTHDHAWYHYMRADGLLEDGHVFKNWSLEEGTFGQRDSDIWDAIETSLKEDDVDTAKTLIRSHLAHIFAFLSDNL